MDKFTLRRNAVPRADKYISVTANSVGTVYLPLRLFKISTRDQTSSLTRNLNVKKPSLTPCGISLTILNALSESQYRSMQLHQPGACRKDI